MHNSYIYFSQFFMTDKNNVTNIEMSHWLEITGYNKVHITDTGDIDRYYTRTRLSCFI